MNPHRAFANPRTSHRFAGGALLACAALALGLAACQAGAGPAAPTPTYSPQATTAAGLVAEGDERLALSDFGGAERAYREAAETDPNFARAYSHLAYAHLFNPETRAAALEEAQRAVNLAPESAEAWAYLARAYDWNGQFEEARKAGEKAVQLDPNNAEARRNLGYLYNALSRHEDALAEWQAAYDLQPQFVHRLTTIAIYYLYLRPDLATGRQWLKDALALAPDDTTALLFLSRLDASTGHNEAAQAGCRRILELAPTSPDGHNCAANAHAQAGEWEAAQAARQQAIEADPADDNSYAGLGYSHFGAGDCRQAAAQFEKAIELKPRSGPNYAGLGLAQMCLGDEAAAIEAYEKAIELEPFNGDHHVGLGQLNMQLGRLSQAEREFKRAVEIDPRSDQYAAWLGRVYAAQGDAEKAIEQYRQALALNPADGSNAATLGFAYLQQGDFEAAVETFEQALERYGAGGASDASLAEVRYGLGLAYVAQDDCARAVPALQEALSLNPALTDAQQYLFACRRSAGLDNVALPADLTASGPLSLEGAVLLLNQALPGLGVQGVARYEQVSGVTVLAVLYAAGAPPNDPAFTLEQSPLVYAGAWALARQSGLVDNLVVVALDANGQGLGSVQVRREYALWWTQGMIDDDAFASLWRSVGP